MAKKKSKKKVAKKKATRKVAKKKTKKKIAKKKAKKKVAKKKAKKKVAKKKTKKKTKKKVAKKKAKKVTKKKSKKKTAKKKTKKKVKKKATAKKAKPNFEKNLHDSLLELLRITSTVIPDDVQKVILECLEREEENTNAEYAMSIIKKNIELAKTKSQPMCQDTGTILIYVDHPTGFQQKKFTKILEKAVVNATKLGYLRQNSVDTLTGENKTMNIGLGHPSVHFHEHSKSTVEVRCMLKGGGCENVGAQYDLPNTGLDAGRDLAGVRKVILDAVHKAQGKGCGPGVLGITIGGDRGSGFIASKDQLLRSLDDKNPNTDLHNLEKDIVETSNKLGIGPMGFGGKTTLLGCKIGTLNRLPASYFVSISYMCWAFRRQGLSLKKDNSIGKWLY